MRPPERGCLLVAAPILSDPNFFRTVVLLLAYDEDGALGVVLNRPSETPIAEIVPSWALHVSPPRVLFSGGPVQPNAAICVGHHLDVIDVEAFGAFERKSRAFDGEDGSGAEEGGMDDESSEDEPDPFSGYSPLTDTIGTVDLHREPEDIDVTFAGLRVFKGYAGWGPRQLDDEIADRAWFVTDGTPDLILTSEPEGLWERVLRAQGGWLSVLARHPVDPTLN
jgi:putative transcriptional regulator